ncbi:MAG: hypothetical protein FGM46_00950 [Ferruginibacter sp.]|nr:hypothetical protein [Ferruginibacter sp.]
MIKKIIFGLFFSLSFASSCTTKNLLERKDADKALKEAVKRLQKDADDDNAKEALPVLYNSIKQKRNDNIVALQTTTDFGKWDKIIEDYRALQNAYDIIINCPAAYQLVSPKSYESELFKTKQDAAESYYQYAEILFNKRGRESALNAYAAYNTASKYITDFKDCTEKMSAAFQRATVNVVVYPVEDNAIFNNNAWGTYGNNYSNEYFQQKLLRDLNSSRNIPAKFYADWEIRRGNVISDWNVSLRLRNLNMPAPTNTNQSRSVNKQIQTGTDSTGKPRYTKVYATVYINKVTYLATAEMELNIRDLKTGSSITYRSFREEHRVIQETATYSGDSRALEQRDWDLINARYVAPRKDEMVNELYRKIYPSVLSSIQNAARG